MMGLPFDGQDLMALNQIPGRGARVLAVSPWSVSSRFLYTSSKLDLW